MTFCTYCGMLGGYHHIGCHRPPVIRFVPYVAQEDDD